MGDILYKSEAYQIIGICMTMYNTLGYGFLEVVYKDAMEIEFQERFLHYKQEHQLQIHYEGNILKHTFFADFTVKNEIIVEVNANKYGIIPEAVAKTLNYLKASGIKLALIINFGKTSLEYKRLLY